MRRLVSLCVLSLALCACSTRPETPAVHRARLLPLASCADLAEQMRERALREMNQKLDEALAQTLADAAGGCRPTPQGGYGAVDTRATGAPPPAGVPTATAAPGAAARPESGNGGASSYSGTNNQVAGVDEADFVKNDAKYIYVAQGSTFRIVEAWPPRPREHGRPRYHRRRGASPLRDGNRTADLFVLPVQPSSGGGGGVAPGASAVRPDRRRRHANAPTATIAISPATATPRADASSTSPIAGRRNWSQRPIDTSARIINARRSASAVFTGSVPRAESLRTSDLRPPSVALGPRTGEQVEMSGGRLRDPACARRTCRVHAA